MSNDKQVTDARLRELVTADRNLDKKRGDATLRLMQHRAEAVAEVGSLRPYADALGVHHSLIAHYANAWAMWQRRTVDPEVATLSPNDCLELAKMSEQRQQATRIVSKATGKSIKTVATEMPEQVRRVTDVLRDEPDINKAIEHATKLTELAQRRHDNAAEQKARKNTSYGRSWLAIERQLGKVETGLRMALLDARDGNLNDDGVELITDRLTRCQNLLHLLNLKVTGSSGIDWDAEAAALLDDKGV